jgi:benzil reductase ((S)-benzoin forming)
LINIIITGGCNGLGGALVDKLGKINCSITIIGRHYPQKNTGNDIHFIELDLSEDISGWKYCINNTASKVLFISNAGVIEPIGSSSEIDQKSLKINHNVNFYSPILIASELSIKTKLNNIDLNIANISSGASVRSIPKWAAYCSSKAAARSFLDCLSEEEAHVQVQHLDPGVLDTDMQKKIRKSEIESKCENRFFSKLKENGELLKPDIAAQKIINELIRKQML